MGRMVWSGHGDTVDKGPGKSGPSNTSRDTRRCVQVRPLLDGAEIMMSPSRNCRASHRRLSAINDRYTTRSVIGCSEFMAVTVG